MWTVYQIVLVEQANDVVMHAFLSRITWQPVQVIGDVTVGVVIQQDLSRLEAAFTRCQEQRRFLLKKKQKQTIRIAQRPGFCMISV